MAGGFGVSAMPRMTGDLIALRFGVVQGQLSVTRPTVRFSDRACMSTVGLLSMSPTVRSSSVLVTLLYAVVIDLALHALVRQARRATLMDALEAQRSFAASSKPSSPPLTLIAVDGWR